MKILILLLPISCILISVAIAAYLWAVNHNQFEDVERRAIEALDDSEDDADRSHQ